MKRFLFLVLCTIIMSVSAVAESQNRRCTRCSGEGKIYEYCSYCKGYGEKYCSTCGGTGQRYCGFCGGSGQMKCSYCRGRGLVNDDTEYCPKCKGYRVVNCDNCEGKGTVPCPTSDCNRGVVPCYQCNKTGIHSWQCPRCHGSGVEPR